MSNAETSDAWRMDLDASAALPVAAPYRVLARKYRPATFQDLIGQDAMVRTLSNAFAAGRIPQAWILTGVRGVGKTTTARIIARALNYELPDGSGGPRIDMPSFGVHCQAIMESRHVDVLEMDAASHNGVDDVRQINDAIRYSPVSARYKVYILDEVHMLSPAAFNALLKTLEEPPPHAKFIFATTEIRKVPVTVLSRCQRFDLRRVEADVLTRHLEMIAAKEGVSAEADALALIARAAEGSVRDALSLLDQAIAHAGSDGAAQLTLRAEDVRQMLGLADRARVVDLFEALMRGDIAGALSELREQYEAGADAAVVLADLAEFTHFVTRIKIVPAVAEDRSISEVERVRGRAFAASLSMRVLSRTWQMLFRGIAEVQSASKPIAAAEMVLVRIAYAADLPSPDELIRSLRDRAVPDEQGQAVTAAPPPATPAPRLARTPSRATSPAAAPARLPEGHSHPVALSRFEDLVALADEKRDLPMRTALERDVRLVRFEDGTLEIALEPGAPKSLVHELSRKISEWTGRRWLVAVSTEQGAPSLRAQLEARRSDLVQGVRADPLVQAVLARFPGAEILDVRSREAEQAPVAVPGEAEASTPLVEGSAFGSRGAEDAVDDDF